MELYHPRTFVAMAEEGNLSRAAGKPHLSQPAVSAHVKALEEELGVSLFVRTARGMEPTASGRRLSVKAHEALARRMGEPEVRAALEAAAAAWGLGAALPGEAATA